MPTYKKISDLDAASTLDGTEILEIVQSSTSKKATVSQINAVSAVETSAVDVAIGDTDGNVWEITPTSANVTVTLPTLADNPGRLVEVHMLGSATGYTVITGEGSETIEGASQLTIVSQYDRVGLRAGSSEWMISQLVASYDTGWVANSDWTDAEFTITHNFGRPLAELIVKFFISTDGTDANALEVLDANRIVDTTDLTTGSQVFAIDNDSLKIQTGTDGFYVLTDSGTLNRIDTESYYYKVVVYRHK